MKKKDLKLNSITLLVASLVVLVVVISFYIYSKSSSENPSEFPLPAAGAIVYYPFNGNANDASGNGINAIVSNANLVTGKIGQAYNFNGVSSYIKIPDTDKLSLSNSVSIGAWVKQNTGNPKKYEDIIMKQDLGYGLQFSSDTGQFTFHIKQKGGALRNLVSNVKPAAGVWYHVVGTYDGTTQKIYINGKLNNQASWKGLVTSSLSPVYLGLKVASDNNYLNGAVDEVKIWNYALSDSEVLGEYNNAPVTCTPQCSGKNCGDDGCGFGGSCGTCASGQTCSSGNCIPICVPNCAGKNCGSDGCVGVCGTCSSTQTCNSGVCTENKKKPIVIYSLEGNTQDWSGNINNNVYNSGVTFTTGLIGQGGLFNGNSYIKSTLNQNFVSNQFTVSDWISLSQLGTQNNHLLLGPLAGSRVVSYISSDNYIHCWSNNVDVFSGIKVSLNTWYYIICSYDGATMKVYVNGALKNSAAASISLNTNNLYIGSDNGAYFTKGKIDEVQIYNSALTAQEVLNEYNSYLSSPYYVRN